MTSTFRLQTRLELTVLERGTEMNVAKSGREKNGGTRYQVARALIGV